MNKESAEKKVTEVKKVTSRFADRNVVKHWFDDGSTKKTFHLDVAQNIYNLDGTVTAIFNGNKIDSKNRLALCVEVTARILVTEKKISKESAILKAKTSAKNNNNVPKMSDFGLADVSRHSVGFLNDLGVRAVNGNKVQNK